jgi:microcystin-dependent protein
MTVRQSKERLERSYLNLKLITLLTIFCVFLLSVSLPALAKNENQPLPSITAVIVDTGAGEMQIFGSGFVDPEVTLGAIPLSPPYTTSTADELIIAIPAITPGDYQLILSQGINGKDTDEYDLTVGGVGPEGPAGADGNDGAAGADGAPGENGADGADGTTIPDGTSAGQLLGWDGGNWVAQAPIPIRIDTTMQPFLTVNYIIALVGTFPSRNQSEPFLAEIIMFGGNFAPRGWAFCDGQLLAISQYSAVFSLLGTTYGGDGRTTFALPDLRGRVPLHAGSGPGLTTWRLGVKGGSETHDHTLN